MKDFVAVVNEVGATALTANDFGGFLGSILTSANASIKRINLLSHANSDAIAFSGTMD